MLQTRISTPADIPRQRELWQLAFGDGGAYVDNFYHTYYKPERMLMLEEDGVVQAMTAWFDTTFAVPGRGEYRAAYLYAVATHPKARGRGLAGRLLSDADGFFRSWGIPAVTTKPAEPSLHRFFGRNGFRECFVHGQNSFHWEKAERNPGAAKSLEPLSPGEYTALRESWLAEKPHIVIPEEMMGYQAGACALTPGGGLYALAAPHGRGRPVRRGDGRRQTAGQGAPVRSGGQGLGAGVSAHPSAQLVHDVPCAGRRPALRHAQVARPGGGGRLGLVQHRLPWAGL